MSYYWFNREKLLKNAWDKYHNKEGKQKAAKYYAANQEVLREDARNKYRNLSEKEKNKKRKYQRERYHMNTDLHERLKKYQRNYYTSKKNKKFVFNVNLVNTNKIVVSDKFKHNDDGFKYLYFIGYLHDDDVIKPLCIILPKMSG